MNIYVGNLSYSATERELTDLFGTFGDVTSATIIKDKMTGRSRGFGFVEMSDDIQGEAAIEALNEQEVGGRRLVVNQARPREERPRRSFDL